MPSAATPNAEMQTPTCWVCGGRDLHLVRRGQPAAELRPDSFRITDSDYGRTGDLYRCTGCGFLECPTVPDVLPFYVEMDDAAYEETRGPRVLQADRLLRAVAAHRTEGRLLDVGAGSGILVEAALARGYQAEGIEPSHGLCRRAEALGLPVRNGVLPHPGMEGPYEIVTLVDVIEHVQDPVGLLAQIRAVLADDGAALIVTPDVRSVAARLMGRSWWHYRLAHVGYFGRSTLALALAKAGLEAVETRRPGWYFPASYLAVRVLSYLPAALRPPVPRLLERVTVPLNLFDSLAVLCRKA